MDPSPIQQPCLAASGPSVSSVPEAAGLKRERALVKSCDSSENRLSASECVKDENGSRFESVSFCAGTIPLLYQPPVRTMASGVEVPDYSQCQHFDQVLHTLAMDKATQLQRYARQYPDQFPMPGMARTLDSLNRGMETLLDRPGLTPSERRILLEQKDLLNRLPAKGFPYQESLFLTYQSLHYKSFFDYLDLVRQCDVDTVASLSVLHSKGRSELDQQFKYHLRRNQISFYAPYCSLEKLQTVPWHLMRTDTDSFARQLSLLYFSSALNRDDEDDKYSGFKAFKSGQLMIPWAGELEIKDLNLGFFLPVWLLGVSMQAETLADGFLMSPAAFFEHDAYHLVLKILEIFPYADTATQECLCQWIKELYQNPGKTSVPSFKAVELVLAYILHEQGSRLGLLKGVLSEIAFCQVKVKFQDLPVRFKDVKQIDLRNAAKWLLESGLVTAKCADQICWNRSFVPVTESDRFDQEAVGCVSTESSGQNQRPSCDTVLPAPDTRIPAVIPKVQSESVAKSWLEIKSLQSKYALMEQLDIDVELLTREVAETLLPGKECLDMKSVFTRLNQRPREAAWLYEYHRIHEQRRLSGQPGQKKESEDMGLFLDDITIKANETYTYLKINQTWLSKASNRQAEYFFTDVVAQNPGLNPRDVVCMLRNRSMPHVDPVRLCHMEALGKKYPLPEPEGRDPLPPTLHAVLGIVENGQVKLWVHSYTSRDAYDACELVKQKRDEGYLLTSWPY